MRALVHTAIGCIQSTLFHNSGLADDDTAELLAGAAHACMGAAPAGVADLDERAGRLTEGA